MRNQVLRLIPAALQRGALLRGATNSIAVSAAATIGTLPFTLFHFGAAALGGLLLNIAAMTLGTYPEAPNGLHDYDLFQEARLQIEKLRRNEKKPFALFISTINTHFPEGIYDQRMEQFVPKNDNTLEFSVAAVDYLFCYFGQTASDLRQVSNVNFTGIYLF